jgi:hypothetical protein
MKSASYSCRILMKIEFAWLIFEKKHSNTKFNENPSGRSGVVHCGQAGKEA